MYTLLFIVEYCCFIFHVNIDEEICLSDHAIMCTKLKSGFYLIAIMANSCFAGDARKDS